MHGKQQQKHPVRQKIISIIISKTKYMKLTKISFPSTVNFRSRFSFDPGVSHCKIKLSLKSFPENQVLNEYNYV